MQTYQHEFIHYAIERGVLRFGDFILKSGRRSPYFFNTGLFDSGASLARLGGFYAKALEASGLSPDILYGPAYKGIPLVCATAMAFSERTGREMPFAFNRKEAKDHGEGGHLVGAPLKGEVLMIDDVITAGTSVRESVDIIRKAGANPQAVLIALDREERGEDVHLTAVEEVEERFGIPVIRIVSLRDIIEYLEVTGRLEALKAIQQYRNEIA